jgi:hypothetical protein
MKSRENKDHKTSPIIMQPEKEKDVSKKTKEAEDRIEHSAPEQFAELKEVNLKMEEEEKKEEENDEEK